MSAKNLQTSLLEAIVKVSPGWPICETYPDTYVVKTVYVNREGDTYVTMMSTVSGALVTLPTKVLQVLQEGGPETRHDDTKPLDSLAVQAFVEPLYNGLAANVGGDPLRLVLAWLQVREMMDARTSPLGMWLPMDAALAEARALRVLHFHTDQEEEG